MIQDLSGSCRIKGTGESTLVMDSPVPLMHHDLDRSWITDPDPDHPKGTQPKFITIRILEHIDTLWNFLEFSARRDSLRCVDWLQRLKLKINCLNGREKRKKDDQTNLNK